VELQILNVLWRRGPSSVGQIHNALKDERSTGRSTTLKMVQVMTEKGLLIKDTSCHPQVYRPAMSQEQAQAGMVEDLIQRAFGGAASKLVLRALQSSRASKEELEQIEELLERIERREQ
jgi:predicted transcriptional regulator